MLLSCSSLLADLLLGHQALCGMTSSMSKMQSALPFSAQPAPRIQSAFVRQSDGWGGSAGFRLAPQPAPEPAVMMFPLADFLKLTAPCGGLWQASPRAGVHPLIKGTVCSELP
jgi:hypothetical protein